MINGDSHLLRRVTSKLNRWLSPLTVPINPINCALAARTRVIVSGDRHLLTASGRAGVRVLRPKAFVDKHL